MYGVQCAASSTVTSPLLTAHAPQMWGSVAKSYIARHSQVLFIMFLVLAFVENDDMVRDPKNISLFFVLFEIASAYGNVGLSINSIGKAYSLSGDMEAVSQVGIILVMMLGT
jgi:Trk-type K+ transport system membrane component